ncbi:MAG: methyltransferase family protein [Smithellaceae bacterium]
MRAFLGELWIPFLIGLLIVASPFLILKIHSDYKTKAELSKLGLVCTYILLGLFCMTIINATLYSRWVFAPDNTVCNVFGYIFMLTGITISVEAFVEFRSLKRIFSQTYLAADKVITTGVYRFSRNPQYIGWHLFFIGLSLLSRSIVAITLILIHLTIFQFIVIPGEEKYLEKLLGDEYMQYKKRVRRWL